MTLTVSPVLKPSLRSGPASGRRDGDAGAEHHLVTVEAQHVDADPVLPGRRGFDFFDAGHFGPADLVEAYDSCNPLHLLKIEQQWGNNGYCKERGKPGPDPRFAFPASQRHVASGDRPVSERL